MVLRAPGMLALHIALDTVEQPVRVRVWNDEVAAYDMGDLAAQWFSDFLGPVDGGKVRLVRFDPEHKRLSNRKWTGAIEAENAFSDGYPILVASTAGLVEFNRRLAQAGQPAVTMERFRPNLVLDGLDAHGEDHLDEIVFATNEGPVRLKLVKPCARCSIPDVDPLTAETGHAVGDVLASYRADARVDGTVVDCHGGAEGRETRARERGALWRLVQSRRGGRPRVGSARAHEHRHQFSGRAGRCRGGVVRVRH